MALAHPQIKFVSNTTVEEVLGVEEKDVKGLRLKNRASGEEYTLPVSFMFLGIGHTPNAQAFKGLLDLDEDGYILTKNNVHVTKDGEILPGVYACGDIQDRRYRQGHHGGPGRGAWRRWRSRSTWRSTGAKPPEATWPGSPRTARG